MPLSLTLTETWSELGVGPLVLQLAGDRPAVCLSAATLPADPLADATALSAGDCMLVGGYGQRVFARAGTASGGSARLLVMTPAEFLCDPPPISLTAPFGLSLLRQIAATGADWRAVDVAAIAQDGVYQPLFPAGTARAGGYIVNTSAPGTAPLWVDPTGARGAQRSTGAMPVYPAQDITTAPGGWRIPATSGAVTVMGPAGATFQAFSA